MNYGKRNDGLELQNEINTTVFSDTFNITCKTAKIMTKMVTTSRQAATASAVMVANGEATCENSPLASTEAPPSSSPKSSGDNCWSPAMRLLPAGDEFMQPPEERATRKSVRTEIYVVLVARHNPQIHPSPDWLLFRISTRETKHIFN